MSISLVPAPSQRAAMEHLVAQAQDNLHLAMPYLSERGISEEMAVKYRLGVHLEGHLNYDQYKGRLVIPYLTRAGVVTVRFRGINNETPKYLSLAGDTGRLYSVGALFARSDLLVITEGEFDALIVNECAATPAVALPGVSMWKPVFARLLKGYNTLLVVGDGDEAGEKFAHDLAGKIGGVPVVMPAGEDVNSYYVKNDAFALIDYLGV